MYNTTGLESATTVTDIFKYANSATNDVLFGSFMIAIFFIFLMIMKRYEFDQALLVDGFVCFILSAILTYSKLLPLFYPLFFLAVAAFTAFYMFVVKE